MGIGGRGGFGAAGLAERAVGRVGRLSSRPTGRRLKSRPAGGYAITTSIFWPAWRRRSDVRSIVILPSARVCLLAISAPPEFTRTCWGRRFSGRANERLRSRSLPHLTCGFGGCYDQWAMADSNGRPPRCKRGGSASEPPTTQQVTETPSAACTNACTSEGENGNAGRPEGDQGKRPEAASIGTPPPDAGRGTEGEGIDQGDRLAGLAAVLLTLSPVDRARLVAMLAGQGVATCDEGGPAT